MSMGCRRLVLLIGAMVLTAVATAPLAGAASAGSPRAVDARILGTFRMRATVTTAVNVRGEHQGQTFIRIWKIVPQGCHGSVCPQLRLDRQRSAGRHDHLTLARVGPGRYAGNGVFYVGLSCNGKTYHHGSRVPFRITLRVRASVAVEGIRFARRLAAAYSNTHRSDATPCPLGPSHDAGRYAGRAISPLPQPPKASFAVQVNARTDVASFTGASHPGAGGARIVSRKWNFGDPRSGSANEASGKSPSHRFSRPGVYEVRLTVLDANGLSATTTRTVTAPGPPTAAFVQSRNGASDVFSFTDRSRPGVGGAAVVAWSWNFGDPASGSSNTSSTQNPTHTFSHPGTYQVTLTVTDANGRTDTATHSVLAPGPPSAKFTWTQDATNPATFHFQDQSSPGYGDAPIVSWQWSFGDGTSSTARNPTHTYGTTGTYTVTLTVTDANGFTSTTSHQVTY